MIRQPVSISFDDRGRHVGAAVPAVPEPGGPEAGEAGSVPAHRLGPRARAAAEGAEGADRITICYDPDDDGVFRKSKDFVTGLNLASGFCIGHGGVYVVQPPYLLFYPDKDGDDVPDGDPEVLLTGFGMEDTHSLANSLQWGPDGWLYGAARQHQSPARSTNPAERRRTPIEFQQGIWRYHPKTKRFELFSEGGGNT